MKNFSLMLIALFSCITVSSYYDVNKKYIVEDTSCTPKSSLSVNYAETKIETYINSNKENKKIRKKPVYEKID